MPVSLLVRISQQRLTLNRDSLPSIVYRISTAWAGLGQQKNSGQTPLGKHYVRAKIGHGLPENTIFRGRRPTGEVYTEALAKKYPERDWILTRILWLCGSEPGFNRLGNVDSMRRYIYIHGTPDSEPMGVALSHGCIRMRNKDIIQLFAEVPPGAQVLITH